MCSARAPNTAQEGSCAPRSRGIACEKIIESSAPHQLAAAFAPAWADVDQIVRRANDLFFVLDNKQGVAFVAQVMHDANESANVARMKSNTWFVHNEKGIH